MKKEKPDKKPGPVVQRPSNTTIYIICPTCSRRHVLSKEIDHWVLEGKDEDWFDDVNGLLYPTFVCKNPDCLYQGNVRI